MVAQLLRIRLQVFLNAFGQPSGKSFATVVGALIGLLALATVCFGLVLLSGAPDLAARNTIIFGGSFVVLAFVVAPILFGSPDDLDPRTLSLFGLSTRSIAVGNAAASAVSIPVIAVAALSMFTVATWWGNAGATVSAIASVGIAVATVVLASRVVAVTSTALFGSLRSREFTLVVLGLLVVLIAPAVILFSSVDVSADGFAAITSAASVVSWTPFGAVWAIAGDLAIGAVVPALLKLAIAVVTVVALWFVWERSVARLLVTPGRQRVAQTATRLGWFDALPASPAAVIGARSLTYWARDSRYLVPLVAIPLVPLFMVGALMIAGVSPQPLALLPVPVMVLFLGWSLHNDLALDSSAIWLHVTAGARGTADRLGRMLPVLLLGIPLVVVGSMVSVMIFGDWIVLPAVIGVNSALFLGGIGLSSYVSARFPYPAVQPGDSPFQQPQSSGSGSVFAQIFALIGALVTAAPAFVFSWLGYSVSPSFYVGALYSGVGIGLVIAAVGVFAGGRVFERRGPEIMSFATSN